MTDMGPEEVWRRKSDEELRIAAYRLEDFTEEGRRVIRAELERRSSPAYLLALEKAAAAEAEASREFLAAQMEPRSAPGSRAAWLARRVFLAIALMLGFYIWAVTIALLLLSIPVAEMVYLGRLHFYIAAPCVGGAFAILWALVPRIDRFEPPGPRLEESEHPRLFQLIREVADATGQAAPADVYLLNEVNAWVTHRGGTMGFGSHRVMGVGLPLLQALSVSELKAITAHEFGHYWSSDVRLGPWIYKTRAVIGRTLAGVHQTFIEAPFVWYGRQFLKLTHAVSRQQEFIADQVAARIAGAHPLAGALRRTAALAPLFSSYLSEDVLPVLRAGFLPPIAAGFDEYLKANRIAVLSQEIIDRAECESETDLFDTHPSLRDRLAALGDVTAADPGGASADSEPALTLIAASDKQAQALLAFAFGRDAVGRLKPIDWQRVGELVFAPGWREFATNYAPLLSGFTADALPAGKHEFIRLGSRLVSAAEQNVNSQDRIARAVCLLAVGIGLRLLDEGWHVSTRPGSPVLLVRGSDTFDCFAAVRALAEGVTTPDAWKAQCQALGISGRPLGGAATIHEAPGTRRPSIPLPLSESRKPAPVNQVTCWRCKHALALSATNRGKTVKCPQCGTRQELPR